MRYVKFLFLVLLLLVVVSPCNGQQNQKSGEEYMKLYEEANHAGDDEKALEYLKLAVEKKYPEALSRMGDAYLNGRYGLNDPEQALGLLQEAAEDGSSRAMTNLGIMYLKGVGIDKDYNTAFSWFAKASDAGDMKAPRYIGLIYENGWGKTVDYEKAAYYYKLAADLGDITGQYYLGQLYEKGLGVNKDYQEAYDQYKKSAARGDVISLPAIMALGNLYEQGLGVDKSTDKAIEWYSKGAALGDSTARAKIAEYQYPEAPYMMNVTAIVKVLGDGQKIAAVAVEYKDTIDEKSISADDYKVEGRTISKVHVNNAASIASSGKLGNFVIVELETTIDKESASMGGGPKPEEGSNESSENKGGQPGFAGPKLGEASTKSAAPVILTAKIAQIGEISTADGQIISSATEMESNNTIDPDIKYFKQLTFHGEEYDRDLMYNLYVPENYDSTKEYPLVLFMHDAGVVSNNHIETLTQGLGAVIWASAEDQAKHPCFVLAPQYNAIMADDNSNTSVDMDITIDLIKSLMNDYSIDPNRLYNTGQSMGGMTSIAMDIKYPDLFAASMLVACQWDPDLVAPMGGKPLWIIVSEGDTKAKPGMDAITEVLKENGSTVTKATWNAEADKETLQKNVNDMLSKDATVNFTVFEGGSHRYTWQYAYSIEGIRDWLFNQHK